MGRGFSFLTATGKNINTVGGRRQGSEGLGAWPTLGKGGRTLVPPRPHGSQSQLASVRLVGGALWGRQLRRQAAGPFTATPPHTLPRRDKGTWGGKSRDASAGVNVKSEGCRKRIRSPPSPRGSVPLARDRIRRGAPGRSLPYQARIPCSVDTAELPCGIPGLWTAFKSPTPKFTKLLLAAAAAVADCAGEGPAG